MSNGTEVLNSHERAKLILAAIQRSDGLRNSYATRGSIMAAASASIIAGPAILLKPEYVRLLKCNHWSIQVWVTVLLACTLWCTARAVWHVVKSTAAIFPIETKYSGPKRLWLNPDDTLDTHLAQQLIIREALIPSWIPAIEIPPESRLADLAMLLPSQLIGAWFGELAFALAVQNLRYQRLRWAVVCVATGFVSFVLLLATFALLLYFN